MTDLKITMRKEFESNYVTSDFNSMGKSGAKLTKTMTGTIDDILIFIERYMELSFQNGYNSHKLDDTRI